MMSTKDILDEKDKRLRNICNEVVFPISNDERKLINDMIEYLTISQNEELAQEYGLRPGMGLAAPQLGLNKRFFVVVEELEDGTFKNHIVFNPKLISNSEEMVYASTGEGCLSINREIQGIVPRYARVTVAGYDIEGNPIKLRAREEVAIAYQHEIDHLNGILFIDHIDAENPYKGIDNLREI